MKIEQNNEKEASGAFFIIPKSLMTSPEYADLSAEACLLYGLMLDRMQLSKKNGWRDNDSFIYFTNEEASRLLKRGCNKTRKIFNELENIGLLRKKKQGQGKPIKYYITDCNVHSDVTNKTVISDKTRHSQFNGQDTHKITANNTDMNNTELSNTLLRGSVEEEVREMIDYDCLIYNECKDDLDNIVDIITDTLISENKKIRIGSDVFPREAVQNRLRSLNSEHISYVLEQIYSNKNPIRDIRSYILKLLYNAPSTINLYYSAMFAQKSLPHD